MRLANPHYLTAMQREGYLALFGFKGPRPASIAETARLAWPEKFLPVFLKEKPVPKGNEAFYRKIWASGKTLEELKAGLVFAKGPKKTARPSVDKRPRTTFRKKEAMPKTKPLPETPESETDEYDLGEIRELDFYDRPKEITQEDEREETRLNYGERTDIVKKYLSDIGEVPLLTAEEELAMSSIFSPYYLRKQRLKSFKEMRDELKQKRPLTITDKKKLAEIRKEIKRHTVFIWQIEHSGRLAEVLGAREKFISANLRLVVSVAKKYIGGPNASYDLLDLVQAGNTGLIKAVEKFDPKKGFKFSTYATWWIRQAITRFLADCGGTVRLPAHMLERVRRHRRIVNQLEQKAGMSLGHEELRSELDVSPAAYERLRICANLGTIPLDASVNPDGDDRTSLMEFFKDEPPRTDETQERDALTAEMRKALAELPEKERDVLCHRFGISIPGCGIKVDREYTLDEVGKMHNVTRERIRQIQVKAMERLSKKARRGPLRKFVRH